MSVDTPTIRVLDFYTKYKQAEDGTTKAVDYVLWAPVGGAMYSQTPERVNDLMPPATFDDSDDRRGIKIERMKIKWAQIEPAYRAWKEGKEVPDHGTPLAAWSGINKEQIKIVQLAGVRTVEELANAPDNVIERIKLPNRRDLAKGAKLFLDSRDQSHAAEKLIAAETEIDILKAQMAELMAALRAEPEADEGDEDKPRRGRPRKDANEAAA